MKLSKEKTEPRLLLQKAKIGHPQQLIVICSDVLAASVILIKFIF